MECFLRPVAPAQTIVVQQPISALRLYLPIPVDGRLVLAVAPLSKGGARRIDHITELARATDRQK